MDKTAGCPLSMQRASVYVGKGKDQMILSGSWSLGRGTLCNKGKWEEMAKGGGNGLSDLGEQREEDHWAWLLRSDPSSLHLWAPAWIWSNAGDEGRMEALGSSFRRESEGKGKFPLLRILRDFLCWDCPYWEDEGSRRLRSWFLF